MTSYIAVCEGCGASFSHPSAAGRCAACSESGWVGGAPAWRRGVRPLAEEMPHGGSATPGYEVLEIIGSGGMGSIHRARQESLKRDVAVKIILEERVNEHDMDRFFREARVLAQLDHPNIVPIYDYGTDADGRCFYTMKMVRGRTLKAILAAVREGRETWTLERLLEVFRKVCDAVAFAHSRGVLHRDLKPENVMVGEFGEVLVMDWGLAGQLKGAGDQTPARGLAPGRSPRGRAIEPDVELTMDGMVLGTPQYMSPEQANACTDLDARSDVYGLGGILYTILTLRPPVPKGTIEHMLESVRTGRIEPFKAAPQMAETTAAQWAIPAGLTAVVRKAMALEREERFPTAGALAADVDAHLAGYATSAQEIGVSGQLWLLIKRHRTVSVALLVLIAVSAGFVVRLVESERRATQNAAATRVALAKSNIALADSAYAGNDSERMRAALAEVPSALRDTNWYYLSARTDERQALIEWEKDSFLIGSAPHPSRPGVFAAATGAELNAVQPRIITFEAATGKVLGSFTQRGGWARCLAFSPDGQRLAIGRIMGGGISIHDPADGRELAHWGAGSITSIAFLPDGERLLVTDGIGCNLFEATTGRLLWKAPSGMAHFVIPGAERIASVSENNLRILSAEDGNVLAKFPLGAALPTTASISPDGALVIVAINNGQIRGVRIADGTTALEVPGGEIGSIKRTAFTNDGRAFVVVASLNESAQSVQVRDTVTGRVLRQLRGGVGGVESACAHPLSADFFIAGARSATWKLPQGREPGWRLASAGGAEKCAGGFLGGDGVILASDGSKGVAALELAIGMPCWKPIRNGDYNAATSADGLTGVTQLAGRVIKQGPHGSGYDFSVIRAEGGTFRETASFYYGTDPVALSVNRDGSRVALSGAWGGVEAYRTSDGGKMPMPAQEDIRFTFGLAWHGTDATRLIGLFSLKARRGFADSEDWIVSWNTDTGERTAAQRCPAPANCLATEPGGTRLAEAGDDKVVRIRDANTLAVLREFRAHDGPINAIAWNPERPILATGSADRSVRLWNVETGELIEELHVGLREPSALYFSPSGRRLACVTPGEKTLIWELP